MAGPVFSLSQTRGDDTPTFSRLTLEDGLSEGQISAITQDPQGIIWAGTLNGLNRYDGYRIHVYTADPSQPSQLACDNISALQVDTRGQLWIGTAGGGLSRYDAARDQFETFRHNPDDNNSLAHDEVWSLFIDSRDRMWMGTSNGIQLIDTDKGTFTRYPLVNENCAHQFELSVRAIAESSQGAIWLGTDGHGLALFTPTTGHYTWVGGSGADPRLQRIRSLYTDDSDTLWIGTLDRGLFQRKDEQTGFFTPADPVTRRLFDDRAIIRRILPDHQGNVWLATDVGLAIFRPRTKHFDLLPNLDKNRQAPGSDNFFSLFEDKEQGLWVGSHDGLHHSNALGQLFRHPAPLRQKAAEWQGAFLTGFAKDNAGNLWVSTYQGLRRINLTTGQLSCYQTDGELNLASDKVTVVHVDKQQRLWLGFRQHGIALLDRTSFRLSHFNHQPDDPGSLPSDAISQIHDAGQDKLWITTFGGGLALFDTRSGQCQRYQHDPQDPQSLADDRLICACVARDGRLWLGSRRGVCSLDPKSGQVLRFAHDPTDSTSLAQNFVNCVLEDHQGNIWIGTQGGGLNLLTVENIRQQRYRFRRFGRQQGLNTSVIYGILEDRHQQLWLSSNHGLIRFDPDSKSFTHFGPEHGLVCYEFNSGAYYQADDGQLFFGCYSGFNAFYPEQINQDKRPLYPLITELKTASKHLQSPGQVAAVQAVSISDSDERLRISFSAVNYSSTSHRYRYQLLGFDSDWVEPPGHHATYTRLPAGRYLFHVEASEEGGDWSAPATLEIQVSPVFGPMRWRSQFRDLVQRSIGSPLLWRQQIRYRHKDAYSKRLEKEVERRTKSLEQQYQRMAKMNQQLVKVNAELEELNLKLGRASITDNLTGLYNRRYCFEQLSQTLDVLGKRRLAAEDGLKPSQFYLLVDIDDLRLINKRHGNLIGDQAIGQVAIELKEACNPGWMLARWTGAQFMISGEFTGLRTVKLLADEIHQRLNKHYLLQGMSERLRLSVSMGFSVYPFTEQNTTLIAGNDVIRAAEIALQLNKQDRFNGWTGLTGGSEMLPEHGFMELLELKLQQVIARKQVALHNAGDCLSDVDAVM